MIKNADLYDLINISLKQNEIKNEQVELFIQRALEGRTQTTEPSKLLLHPIRENEPFNQLTQDSKQPQPLPRFNNNTMHSPVRNTKENFLCKSSSRTKESSTRDQKQNKVQ
jgi:hypothetical protein